MRSDFYRLSVSKSILFSLMILAAFWSGPIMAAQDAVFCPADRLNSNGNICNANDVELAAAVVGQNLEGAVCKPGQQFDVEINGTLTVRTERSDIGVWIATDGKPIGLRGGTNGAPDEGGSQSCEVMPLTGPHGVTPESIGDPFLVYDFEPQGDCSDVSPVTNLDTSENVQLTSVGDSIIDGRFDINNDGVIDENDDDSGLVDGGLDDGQIAWYKVIDGGIDINQDGVVNADDDGFWPGAVVGVQSYAVIDGEIDVDGSGTVGGEDDDARSFNDAVKLACVPGPNGGILLPSLVSWIQPGGAGGVCDSNDPGTYPLQSSKCSTSEVSLDVDVVGKVTVVKNAPAADGDIFTFAYTNSQVTNADSDLNIESISVGCFDENTPCSDNVLTTFGLVDGSSGPIYTVIGNPDTVNGGLLPGVVQITEGNLPTGWELASIQCVDTDNPANDISGLVNVNLNQNTVTVTMNYNEADPTATIDDITCTFNNQPIPATLTVVKNTLGGDGTFPFLWASTTNQDPGQNFELTTVGGTISTTVEITTGLGDTDFAIIENNNPLNTGFEFVSAVCRDENNQIVGTPNNIPPLYAITNLTLDAGTDITCTFVNQALGTVTINKSTVGGDGTFQYTSVSGLGSLGNSFGITTVSSSGSSGAVLNLSPGSYDVTETDPQVDPSGWDFTSLTCNDSDTNGTDSVVSGRTATINLDPGETISCTYTNTKRGVIIIQKQTLPDGSPETFEFTGDVSGTIGDDEAISVLNLLPGQYTSTESLKAGWVLTDITCTGANSSGDTATRTATINLEAGETEACIFTNTQNGSITVVKDITATGPASQTFSFSGTGVGDFDFGGGFTLTPTDADTPDAATFSGLPPGAYSLAEANPIASGWQLTNAICSNGNDPSSITLAPGVDLVCTFTNSPLGSSTITKNSVGGTGLFGFTWENNVPEGEASTFDLDTVGDNTESRDFSFKLIPATAYDLTETSLPADVGPYNQSWVQTNVGCQDPTQDSTVPNPPYDATILADSGETVSCTFTNTLDGTLIVRKETIPDGIDVAFSFAGDAALTGSIRDYSAFTEELVLTAQPGTFGTVETVPNGWSLSNINCTGGQNSTVRIGRQDVFTSPGFNAGDDQIEVDLEAGETVICTFTNTLQGGITINKVVEGADAGFNFNASYDVDGFTLSNGEFDQSQPLQTGSYTITESLPAGYALTDISCPGEYNSTIQTSVNGVEIGLVDGEQVECTFTNTELGSITIEKQTLPDGSPQSFSFSGAINTSLTDGLTAGLGDILPGQYTVTEAAQAGWDLTDITCTGDDDSSGDIDTRTATFNIAPGEDVTCVFTNTQRANIVLDKTVVVDDGGTATQADFQAYIDGSPADWDTSYEVLPNIQYTASEDQVFGYTASAWGGDCAADGTVTPLPGQTVTCTITNDDIAPTLTLVKTVINDNGGSLAVSDFPLFISGTPATSGTAYSQTANVQLTASETTQTGYAPSAWGGDCAADGTITLLPGDVKTCTITNDDVAPTLTLVKTVINDNGGSLAVSDFPLFISGTPATSGTAYSQTANVQLTASETTQTGYAPSAWGGDCAADGTITLLPGDAKTCTITNDDVAPTLTLVKTVVNDNGGNLTQADFPSFIDGSPVAWDTPTAVTANEVLTASETPQTGYAPSAWGGDCAADGTITLLPGDAKTCTITNDDVAPTLTLVKTVVNDNGGNLTQADFPSFIDGSPVAWDTPTAVTANEVHTASETEQNGYLASTWGGDCAADGTITLLPGDAKTCTITNDDVAPQLTLLKDVTNDNGGDAVPGSFTLLLDDQEFTSGATPVVVANQAYTISELPLEGYTQTDIVCTDDLTDEDLGNPVTLGVAQSATCTVFNDDDAPQLTVVKIVINDDGGSLTEDDFTLHVTGDDGQQGTCGQDGTADYVSGAVPTPVFSNCPYTLSEDPVNGYNVVDILCFDDGTGNPVAHPATLNEGQAVTCYITNDDAPPGLTLLKSVTNDDGGDVLAGDFTLRLTGGIYDGTEVFGTGDNPPVESNVAYTLSEDAIPGYTETGIECIDNSNQDVLNHPVTLAEGQSVTCTISNDDDQPFLTLEKVVITDDGGSAIITDWTLTATGSPTISGSHGDVVITGAEVNAGQFTLTESNGPDGYTQTSLECVGNATPLAGNVLTVGLGEDVSCTFTNDDVAPGLTVIKQVTNDDGGNALPDDFMLTVGGAPVLSGVTGTYAANTPLTINETLLTGYTFVSITGDEKCPQALGGTITLAEGDDITCTITNDDVAPQLTLIKDPTNDDGGNALPDDFNLTIGGNAATSGTAYPLLANTPYAINETLLTGYTFVSITGDPKCPAVLGGEITLDEGDDVTCTITNDDVAPTLTLIKSVTNDDGGNALPDDFGISVGGNVVTSGATNTYQANTPLAIDEVGLTGYTFVSITGDPKCPAALGGTVTLDEGDDITCTITNDDVAPGLTLVKIVINDDGGTALPDDFLLTVDGTAVLSGESNEFAANVPLAINETLLPGYAFVSITGDAECPAVLGGTVTLAEGDAITCTITNDDIAPKLTVVKTVINDDGGVAAPDDFMLTVGGAAVLSGVSNGYLANIPLAINETLLPGYAFVSITGDAKCPAILGGTVTLAEGDDITCTITNDDVAPGLTLIKIVINDDGGTALPDDFLLTVDGTAVLSGEGNEFVANVPLAINETLLPGYAFVSITGDAKCPAVLGGTVTLAEGDAIACTITNDDVAPKLTLVKVVNGGSALPDDFLLTVDGDVVLSGESNEFEANLPLAIGETLLPDYDFVSITGDAKCPDTLGGTITLDLGDDVSCTLTNALRPPVLQFTPVPVNNPLALFLLTLMLLATGWYFRPAAMRRF